MLINICNLTMLYEWLERTLYLYRLRIDLFSFWRGDRRLHKFEKGVLRKLAIFIPWQGKWRSGRRDVEGRSIVFFSINISRRTLTWWDIQYAGRGGRRRGEHLLHRINRRINRIANVWGEKRWDRFFIDFATPAVNGNGSMEMDIENLG